MFRFFSTAFAVFLAVGGALPPAFSATPSLTLDEAFDRVVAHHPVLRLIDVQRDRRHAEHDEAALHPALRLGVDVENVLGTGDHAGVASAEVSLTLASLLERGGKRAARRALASARLDALDMEREAQRLDLLADVARRYLDLADAQARIAIADEDIALRQRTLDAARQRYRIGAGPESSALAAEGSVARARLARERAVLNAEAAWRRLALMWGETDTDTDTPPTTAGSITRLPTIIPVDTLLAMIDDTPAITRFANETRVREARLRLAESQRTPDVEWQLGVRRLQGDGDMALMAGFSVPLGSRSRTEPGIRAARAELLAVSIEREVDGLGLRAALLEAHGRFRAAHIDVSRIDTELMPLLKRTERAADAAYRRGALSWLEWAQVQADIIALLHERLSAALDARRAVIEIQRLTAEPMVLVADGDWEVTP